MRTEKQTIITLDAGDSITIRTLNKDGSDIMCQVTARNVESVEALDAALILTTDEVVWVHNREESITEKDITEDGQLLIENARLEITLV